MKKRRKVVNLPEVTQVGDGRARICSLIPESVCAAVMMSTRRRSTAKRGAFVEHLLRTAPCGGELVVQLGRQRSGDVSSAWQVLGTGQSYGLVSLIWCLI